MSFVDDPSYSAIVEYFNNGGVTYSNPAQPAFDALCVTMTGNTSASLPTNETALIAMFAQMQDRLTNADMYFSETAQWATLLQPINPQLTEQFIQESSIDCILTDFATTIAGWQTQATANPSSTVLRTTIQTFATTQQTNLTNFQNQANAALSAVNAISIAQSGNVAQQALVSSTLAALLKSVLQAIITFGTIGKTPGEEYQAFLTSTTTPTPTPASPNPGNVTAAPAAAPTPNVSATGAANAAITSITGSVTITPGTVQTPNTGTQTVQLPMP
jgi:hypothetical protein